MNGFHRLAAAVPVLRVGDPEYNVERMLELYARACDEGAAIVVFPELAVTGYSCGDMFEQQALLDAADGALARFISATAGRRTIAIARAPLPSSAATAAAFFPPSRPATTTAAPPSVICEEFPAVTEP